MPWKDVECPHCGTLYRDFRTGYTYRQVYRLLWSSSSDSSDWRYKRRGTVLGKWHQLKKELWERHVEGCEKLREDKEDDYGVNEEDSWLDHI